MYHLTSTDIARWLIELLATYARKLRKQISKFNRLTRIELSVPEFFAVCGKIHLEQYRIPPSYKSAMIAASLGAPVEVCDRIWTGQKSIREVSSVPPIFECQIRATTDRFPGRGSRTFR